MALRPENPVVGGTALRRQAIESPNFVTGSAGWIIRQDGSVEFNNGVFRGTISGGQLFIYSGTPGVGNLVLSSANPGTTTDQFGNNVIGGATATYGAGFANAIIGGAVIWYTGSLAGGWAFAGQLELFGTSALLVDFPDFQVTGTMEVTGNTTITGTLSVNGSGSTATPSPNATSTNGLADGTIHGTSGGASAGTAHTHGPGSFAVGSGLHSHDTQNHTHVL